MNDAPLPVYVITVDPAIGSPPVTPTPIQAPQDEAQLEAAALAEVVSLVCATLETVDSNPDLPAWIAAATEEWGSRHARQAVVFIGMLAQGCEIGPEVIADLGRTIIGV